MSGEHVDELLVKLGLTTDAKGFRDAQNHFAMIRTTALAVGTAAVGAGIGLGKMSDGIARSTDRLGKWADSADVGIRKAQQLKFALEKAGSANPESEMMSMFANVESLRTQAQRGELSSWALVESGMGLYNLRSMDNEQALDYLMKGLSEIQDPQKQRRALQELNFSSPAQYGVMTNYAATHASYRRSDELGNAGEDLFENSAAYMDAMTELAKALNSFKEMVAIKMLPGMAEFATGVTNWSVDNREEIEQFFTEAMPYFKATAAGIGALVAAQVGKKGLALMAAAAAHAPAAAAIGLGAFYLDDDERTRAGRAAKGSTDYWKRQLGLGEDDPRFTPHENYPEGWNSGDVPMIDSRPPSSSSGRLIRDANGKVIRSSSSRAPGNGLTADEMSYNPSASELIPQGNHSDLREGYKRLLNYQMTPPVSSTSSSSTNLTVHVDARGAADPGATSERVRRVVREEVGKMVDWATDGISKNVV